jgi:acetoin utilization deacetylase AcuC-like enzyme
MPKVTTKVRKKSDAREDEKSEAREPKLMCSAGSRLLVIKQDRDDSSTHCSTKTVDDVPERIEWASDAFVKLGVHVHYMNRDSNKTNRWGTWAESAARVHALPVVRYLGMLDRLLALSLFVVHEGRLGQQILPDCKKDCFGTIKSNPSIYSALRTSCGAVALSFAKEKASMSLHRPPGHHAKEDCARGFCWRNNSLVALVFFVSLVREFGNSQKLRLLLFDFDYHHGKGTEEIIESGKFRNRLANKLGEVEILYFSVFRKNSFDGEELKEMDETTEVVQGKWPRRQPYLIQRWHSSRSQWKRQQTATRLSKICQAIVEYTAAGHFSALVVAAGFDHCKHEKMCHKPSNGAKGEEDRLWSLDEIKQLGSAVSKCASTCRLLQVPISILEGGYKEPTMRQFLPAYAMHSAGH